MMNSPSTQTPQESLRALERAVAQRLDWRILTGSGDDPPRFVIEKPVRYDLIRGWPMVATYRITGGFQQTQSGTTTLCYAVSGQAVIPFIHAALPISVLLAITLLLGSFVFSPTIVNQWIGILLLGVLQMSAFVYGWIAYHSYRGHLRELRRFMEAFAQQTGIQPETIA